jgi:hypothetical protein
MTLQGAHPAQIRDAVTSPHYIIRFGYLILLIYQYSPRRLHYRRSASLRRWQG